VRQLSVYSVYNIQGPAVRCSAESIIAISLVSSAAQVMSAEGCIITTEHEIPFTICNWDRSIRCLIPSRCQVREVIRAGMGMLHYIFISQIHVDNATVTKICH